MGPQETQLFIATAMSLTITIVIIILLLVKEEKDLENKSMEEKYLDWAKSDNPSDTEEFRKSIMKI